MSGGPDQARRAAFRFGALAAFGHRPRRALAAVAVVLLLALAAAAFYVALEAVHARKEAEDQRQRVEQALAAATGKASSLDGSVEVAEGNLAEGMKSFQASFAIRDRMAKFETGDAGWQRDLVVSYGKIAEVYRDEDRIPEAADALRRGREIVTRLTRSSPGDPILNRTLAWLDGQLAELTRDAGGRAAAMISCFATNCRATRGTADKLMRVEPRSYAAYKV